MERDFKKTLDSALPPLLPLNGDLWTGGGHCIQYLVGVCQLFKGEVLIELPAVVIQPQPGHRQGLAAAPCQGQTGVPGQGPCKRGEGEVLRPWKGGKVNGVFAETVLLRLPGGFVIPGGVLQRMGLGKGLWVKIAMAEPS